MVGFRLFGRSRSNTSIPLGKQHSSGMKPRGHPRLRMEPASENQQRQCQYGETLAAATAKRHGCGMPPACENKEIYLEHRDAIQRSRGYHGHARIGIRLHRAINQQLSANKTKGSGKPHAR